MKHPPNHLPRSVYAPRLREFPEFVFAEEAVFRQAGRWREFFRHRIGSAFDGRIIVEIGCFDAEYLARIATKNPATGFVGIDWKCKPLYDGARRMVESRIRNVALLRGRGQDLGRMFSSGEVDELWVFHPDPCDQPGEAANRLISTGFLSDVLAVLRDPMSLFCLKTDHPEYYQQVMGLLDPSRFEVTAISTDYWHDPAVRAITATRHFAGEMTLFENRFIRRGQPIYYVELRKNP